MTHFHMSLFSRCELNNNIANSLKKSTKLSKNVENLPILLITLYLRTTNAVKKTFFRHLRLYLQSSWTMQRPELPPKGLIHRKKARKRPMGQAKVQRPSNRAKTR